MEDKEIVLKAMVEAKQPLKSGEVAEITKLDKKIVDKVLKTLKTEDKIYSPKRCYYEPKL